MEDGLVVDVFFPVDDKGFALDFDGDDFHLNLSEGGEEDFKLALRSIGGDFTSDIFLAKGDDFVYEKVTLKEGCRFFGMVLNKLLFQFELPVLAVESTFHDFWSLKLIFQGIIEVAVEVLFFERGKGHFIELKEKVFEDDLILREEELGWKSETVVSEFQYFLLWGDGFGLKDVHEVADLIEEFISVAEHVFQVLEPGLWGPILAGNVFKVFGRFEEFVFEELDGDVGAHEMVELFVVFDDIDLGLGEESSQVVYVGWFLFSVGIDFFFELVESLDEG